MDAKVLFSVAIRVLGLWYAARGFNDLIYFFVVATGIKTVSVSAALPYTELVYGLFFFIAGLYLLRGAPLVVAYASSDKHSETGNEIEQETPKNDNSN